MTDTRTEYLPEIYEQFRRDFPDIAHAYDALSSTLHDSGPLDRKSRRLTKLAASVGAESQGAVRSHVRKALDEGLSRPEIEHAILLTLTVVGFPAMVAALKWAREVFAARG
jgi:alkylhydroperoxidase/carboxymuconolactone decarboxylase family protein YurZ